MTDLDITLYTRGHFPNVSNHGIIQNNLETV